MNYYKSIQQGAKGTKYLILQVQGGALEKKIHLLSAEVCFKQGNFTVINCGSIKTSANATVTTEILTETVSRIYMDKHRTGKNKGTQHK